MSLTDKIKQASGWIKRNEKKIVLVALIGLLAWGIKSCYDTTQNLKKMYGTLKNRFNENDLFLTAHSKNALGHYKKIEKIGNIDKYEGDDILVTFTDGGRKIFYNIGKVDLSTDISEKLPKLTTEACTCLPKTSLK